MMFSAWVCAVVSRGLGRGCTCTSWPARRRVRQVGGAAVRHRDVQPGVGRRLGRAGGCPHLQHDPPAANPGLHVTVSNGCSADLGVAASLAKTYMYYAAKSGGRRRADPGAEHHRRHPPVQRRLAGTSAPETSTDYSNFASATTTNFEGLFIPSGWTGSYPSLGSAPMASADNTFLSIRPWYTSVANYPEVQNYLNGGTAPVVQLPPVLGGGGHRNSVRFSRTCPRRPRHPHGHRHEPGYPDRHPRHREPCRSASDSDAARFLSNSSTDLPFGLSLNVTTAMPPHPTPWRPYLTTLTVNDGTGVLVNLNWTIDPKRTGNVITGDDRRQPDQTAAPHTSLQIQATNSGPGKTLTYAAAGLPTGLTMAPPPG